MFDPWTALGLEGPTRDLRVIKKAYALKLKGTRPEDDPEGFMRLREALEEAKRLSQSPNRPETDLPFSGLGLGTEHGEDERSRADIEISTSEIHDRDAEPELIREYSPIKTREEIWRDKIIQIIESPWKRGSVESWRALFDDEEFASIDVSQDFKTVFRETLLDYFGYFNDDQERHNQSRERPLINNQIGTFIFEEMGWFIPENASGYIQHQIDFLRQDLDVLNKNRLDLGLPAKEIPLETQSEEDGFSWGIMFSTLVILTVVFQIANRLGGG